MTKEKENLEHKKYKQKGKVTITNRFLSRTRKTIKTQAKGMI